ncbi:glutathione amide-dependent peroxidase [Thalassotalea insulae]|uniref:Glutathione amide-dependent peroxidase n=1 Tax=Thalassotalea insulae TaxID=2056778 RepID=A0ABQ6GQI0_9GAMM|nr:glutathione peroxidase [Thalassotalea insulae]GLX78228.1 glutathione amide-dependent peroxidase [Thalassotalea insulae]
MFANKEGHSVPQVTFTIRDNEQWLTRTSDEIFRNKKVVLFALPGAFTPTCSSTHLPRYNELAQQFYQQGIDEILCLSVNDTFVMNAWAQDQQAQNISFLPDGNGEFSQAIGMLVDKSTIGFGKRSWRYAMLVEDGVIKKMFIEPDVEGDPFEVSDADTMLAYINPEAVQQQKIAIFTKPSCPYCKKAKALLRDQGLSFEEIDVANNLSLTTLKAVTGNDTVPQTFIDGQHIGGSEALASYFS